MDLLSSRYGPQFGSLWIILSFIFNHLVVSCQPFGKLVGDVILVLHFLNLTGDFRQ